MGGWIERLAITNGCAVRSNVLVTATVILDPWFDFQITS